MLKCHTETFGAVRLRCCLTCLTDCRNGLYTWKHVLRGRQLTFLKLRPTANPVLGDDEVEHFFNMGDTFNLQVLTFTTPVKDELRNMGCASGDSQGSAEFVQTHYTAITSQNQLNGAKQRIKLGFGVPNIKKLHTNFRSLAKHTQPLEASHCVPVFVLRTCVIKKDVDWFIRMPLLSKARVQGRNNTIIILKARPMARLGLLRRNRQRNSALDQRSRLQAETPGI